MRVWIAIALLLVACSGRRADVDEPTPTAAPSPSGEITPTEAATPSSPLETPTEAPTSSSTPTGTPTAGPTPTETPVPTVAPPQVPCPGFGLMDEDGNGLVDQCESAMVRVPAGEAVFGTDMNDPSELIEVNNNREHIAYISEFSIEITEVTHRQYLYFLAHHDAWSSEEGVGWVYEASALLEWSEDGGWEVPEIYLDAPVVGVTWYGARDYCEWVGKRLPTEHEWEKAARGGCELAGAPELCDDPEDERSFPWGNSNPQCHRGNFVNSVDAELCVGDVVPVGSYPEGASAYGVLDMAGNASEWVSDNYKSDWYYDPPDYLDPVYLDGSDGHVRRGGNWSGYPSNVHVADRDPRSAASPSFADGFRCAY